MPGMGSLKRIVARRILHTQGFERRSMQLKQRGIMQNEVDSAGRSTRGHMKVLPAF